MTQSPLFAQRSFSKQPTASKSCNFISTDPSQHCTQYIKAQKDWILEQNPDLDKSNKKWTLASLFDAPRQQTPCSAFYNQV